MKAKARITTNFLRKEDEHLLQIASEAEVSPMVASLYPRPEIGPKESRESKVSLATLLQRRSSISVCNCHQL
jgi:hypothetical protein